MAERRPIRIAKVSRLLSRRYDGRFSYALFAFAGAVIFFMAAGTHNVFADSALQHAQDAPSVIQAGHSYIRAVSDSVSVASMFDNSGSRVFASRTIVRGISDGVGVASEFGSPAGQQATSPATTRGYGPSIQPPSQRSEERLGQRMLLGNKGESRIYNNAVTQSATPSIEVSTEAGNLDFNEVATLGDSNGSDPDSNSGRLAQAAIDAPRSSAAMQGMMVYSNAVFGVYSFATIALVVSKSPRLKRRRVMLGTGRAFVISIQNRDRLVVIVVAAVASATALAVGGPFMGAAYAENSKIEASAAYHLDVERKSISDIYLATKNQDSLWSEEISDGQSVRVTFEQELGAGNDITIYPRVVSGNPKIEVYEVNGNKPIAEFAQINSDEYNKVYLTNLRGSQKTFDLKVIGGSARFDQIVDPQSVTVQSSATSLYAGTAFPGTVSYTIASGTDRLLVVGVASAITSATTQTATVTYGGVSLTKQITDESTSARQHTWLFYLKDNAVMDGTAKNLVVTVTGGTASRNYVYAAVFATVDQTTPITDSQNYNGGTSTTTTVGPFGTALTINSGEVAAEIVMLYRTGSTTARTMSTWASGWSSALGPNSGNDGTNSGSAYVASDSTTGTTTSQHTSSGTSLKTMSAMSINPAPFRGSMSDSVALTAAVSAKVSGRSAADSTTVTDSLVAKITGTGLSDSTTVTDSVVAKITKRAVADSLTISDARIVMVTRPLSETLTITDSISAKITGRALSDSILLTDTVVRTVTKSRAASDTFAVTDAIVVVNLFSRNISQVVVTTDSPASRVTYARSISDAITTTDQVLRNYLSSRTPSDVLAITDSSIATALHSKLVSDVVALTSNAVATKLALRLTSDTITTTDAASVAYSATRSTSDTLGVTVQIHVIFMPSKTATDTLVVSDSISHTSVFSRSVSEAFIVSDSTGRKLMASSAVSDSFGTADTITVVFLPPRSESDTMAVTDSIARLVVFARSVSDSAAIADAAGRVYHTFGPISDALVTSDSVSGRLAAFRNAAESISISYSIQHVALTFVNASDAVTVADSSARRLLASRALSESITVVDTLVRVQSLSASMSDTLTASDLATGTYATSRSPTETLTVLDSAVKVSSHPKSVSNIVAIMDAIAATKLSPAAVNDTTAITDAIYRTYSATTATSDPLGISDQVSAVSKPARTTSDSLAVTDAIAARVSGRSVSDSVALVDSIQARITSTSALLSDSLSISDAVSVKITSRAIADGMTVSDAIEARITASAIADSLDMNDDISAKVRGRSAADAVAISDNLFAAVTARAISDSVAVTDTIVPKVTATTTADAIAISDRIAALVNRAIADTITPSDSISMSVTRSMQETLSASDGIEMSASTHRNASDNVTATDSISTSVTRTISDSLTVEDTSRASSVAINIADSVSVTDYASIPALKVNVADALSLADQPRVSALVINIADLVEVVDTARTTSVAINISDSLAMADSAQITALSVGISDSLAVRDSASATMTPIFGDTLSLTDTISLSVARFLLDSVSISDTAAAGTPVVRNLSDSLAMADGTQSGKAIAIDDTLSVAAQIPNISVQWSRSFNESLGMVDCTPFSCVQSMHFNEGLTLADEYVPPPTPAELLSVADSISTIFGIGRGVSDNLIVMANPDILAAPAAPPPEPGSPLPSLPVLIVTNTTAVGVPPSAEVNMPPLSWNGDTQALKDTLKPSRHLVNATISGTGLSHMFVALPTYHVSLTPTPEIPGSDLVMSAMVDKIPAGTPTFVPINIAETPGLSKHNAFAKWMTLGFTPNIETTNFALVVSFTDEPPRNLSPPDGDINPLYLDIRWIGDFADASNNNPSNATYYQNPPRFTFAVTDDWAQTNGVQRDENGVPIIALSLLNDVTGKWAQVAAITPPLSGVNGVYTYIATLPHFSNYAITANKVTSSTTTSGGLIAKEVQTPTAQLVVNIADSLGTSDSQKSTPVETIEEFGQKRLVVAITDSVAVLTRPVSYKTFQVGDVNVKITILDVKQESILPPKATATLLLEMENSGSRDEKFTLNFWYYDEGGKKPYESSQVEELGPQESKQLLVDLPFTSPGIFEVTAEARSFPDNELVNAAQLTVTIPWLTINLYLLVVVAVVILGASGAVLALLVSRMGIFAAGGEGLLSLLLLKKPQPRVRVTENIEGIEDYDLLVQVKSRDGTNMQTSPASLDTEIANMSRRNQTFVLSYWSMDESGVRMREKSDRITIGARKTVRMVMSLDLPKGTYIFAVEAKPPRGNDVWSHTRLRIRVL